MHDAIARLRTRPGIEVVDLASAWEIRVPKPGGMLFVVTLPHDVLELFVVDFDVL